MHLMRELEQYDVYAVDYAILTLFAQSAAEIQPTKHTQDHHAINTGEDRCLAYR